MRFNKDKFRKIRELKMTGAELAECMAVTRSAVTQWETGATAPSSPKFGELARVLDCAVADFCDEDGEVVEPVLSDFDDNGSLKIILSAWPRLTTSERVQMLRCLVDIYESRANEAKAKEREAEARVRDAETRAKEAEARLAIAHGLCKSQAAENETLNGGEAPGSKE